MIPQKRKLWAAAGSTAGFIAGVATAVWMPADWSNLAFAPWYVVWFVLPAFVLFATICIPLGIDFISNTANAALVTPTWILAVAVVMAAYGWLISLIAFCLLGQRADRSRGEA